MKPHTRPIRHGLVRAARPLAGLALGAVLATSACGQASSSSRSTTPAPGAPSSTGSAPTRTAVVGGLRLEVTTARASQVQGGSAASGTASGTASGIPVRPGLVVDYRLTNNGPTAVLAYDVVPQDLGSATLPADVDPQHAWVYEQAGVLRLSKQGFATAPNVRFAAAPVIGAHTVAPGASLTGRAYAAWPPALDVPGESFSAPRQPVDPAVATWQFCLQVDGRTAQSRPSAVSGVVQVPVAAPQGDELVCTPPADSPAP